MFVIKLVLIWLAVSVSSNLKEHFVGPLNVILLVIMFLSGLATILLVLMHSGKGTGVSDMIASSMYNAAAGSSIVEKNLDRITIICAIVFLLSLIILMIIYPQGTINAG